MAIPDDQKLPDDAPKSELDKFDLEANESLGRARAYILFTVKDTDGDMSFNYDPSKLNDLEMIGFLTTAINHLKKIKSKVEYYSSFDDDEDDDDPCNGCEDDDCENCDSEDD